MVHLKKNGPGLFHLSLGAVPDHDEMVSACTNGGIDVEMTHRRDVGNTTVTLLATQPMLGTNIEVEKHT